MITEENLVATLTEYGIPERMHDGIHDYLFERVRPGSFLCSIFSNDLVGAISNADDENLKILFNYANVLYNQLPSNKSKTSPWGSPEALEAWLKEESQQ